MEIKVWNVESMNELKQCVRYVSQRQIIENVLSPWALWDSNRFWRLLNELQLAKLEIALNQMPKLLYC